MLIFLNINLFKYHWRIFDAIYAVEERTVRKTEITQENRFKQFIDGRRQTLLWIT